LQNNCLVFLVLLHEFNQENITSLDNFKVTVFVFSRSK
jgi:hypothetical protein